jgi:hypothetical protein
MKGPPRSGPRNPRPPKRHDGSDDEPTLDPNHDREAEPEAEPEALVDVAMQTKCGPLPNSLAKARYIPIKVKDKNFIVRARVHDHTWSALCRRVASSRDVVLVMRAPFVQLFMIRARLDSNSPKGRDIDDNR